mmetsp:Transcript_2061/g.4947  ORF Transcript_2061/g.4947 Transcript_2061/m.4947 type:complete len:117 (-) Transcript_2061:30-380(-)
MEPSDGPLWSPPACARSSIEPRVSAESASLAVVTDDDVCNPVISCRSNSVKFSVRVGMGSVCCLFVGLLFGVDAVASAVVLWRNDSSDKNVGSKEFVFRSILYGSDLVDAFTFLVL